MRRHFDVLEEKRIGKIKDIDIFRKLIEFSKPYKHIFIFCVLLIFATTFFQLGMPYIMKAAIDRGLMPTSKKLIKTNEFTQKIRKKYPKAFVGNFALLPALPRAIKKDMEVKKYFSPASYFALSENAKVDSILNMTHLSHITQNNMVFIPQNQMYKLSPHDLGILRWEHYRTLLKYSLIYLGFLLLSFIFTFLQVYFLQYFGQLVIYDLRMAIYKKIMKLPISYFDKNPTGRIVTRATNDVNAINEMFSSVLVYTIKDFFLLSGILIIMFKLSPSLSIKILLLVPFIIGLSFVFQKYARKAYRNVRMKLSKLNAFTQESVSGIEVVHIFYAMKKMIKRYKNINHELYKANIEQMYVYAFFRPLMEMMRVVAVAMIVYFGGRGILSNYITFGTLVAFLSYIDMFFSPIRDLAEKYNILQSSFAAGERIILLLNEEEEKQEGKIERDIQGEIEFDHVWFSYNNDRWILKDVSFKVDKGKTVAIVGPTGAGKTSTISLLARFYDNQKGKIKIDDERLKDYNIQKLRREMAFVFQDVFIFKKDVKKNIALWDDIDDKEIEEALKITYSKEFVERLPQGIHTKLGERGITLSMGQRQLLSFARALVRKPKILVLDEATSNIDTYTEHLIEKALRNLIKDRTSIIIAHRLSTIKNANKIMVILEGKLVEEGTHQELMKKNGVYAKLYKIQFELSQKEAV